MVRGWGHEPGPSGRFRKGRRRIMTRGPAPPGLAVGVAVGGGRAPGPQTFLAGGPPTFGRPHRPLLVRVANHVGRAVEPLVPRAAQLDSDNLIETARRRRGLERYDLPGVPGSRHLLALEALVSALSDEAVLTPAGRYFSRGQLISSLVNRLELAAALEQDPTLRGLPLSPALVIVGLPRSGTTLLQHLLARDPEHRFVRHWEAARPCTPRGAEGERSARRAMDRSLKLLDYLAPDARSLHPVGTSEPTECVTLFSNSFASLELATMHQIPSYLDWCLTNDLAFAYDEYAQQLRVLQRNETRSRWLLKSPAHLFWLDQLGRVLPGARVIRVHRDPLEVLGSFCSLAAVLSGISSDRIECAAIGARWAPAWATALSRAAEARREWPDDRWVDIAYTDLVADPLAEVRRIYAHFGLELRDATEASMASYLAAQPRSSTGAHRYTLAQFGLDPDREAERFAAHRAASADWPTTAAAARSCTAPAEARR